MPQPALDPVLALELRQREFPVREERLGGERLLALKALRSAHHLHDHLSVSRVIRRDGQMPPRLDDAGEVTDCCRSLLQTQQPALVVALLGPGVGEEEVNGPETRIRQP